MKKTSLLRNLLSHHQAALSPEEFKDLSEETERLIGVYIEILSREPSGASRAKKAHALIDEQNDKASHVPVSCAKGCGFCCHLEVEITEDDAERLADAVLERGLELDTERLKEQAGRQRLDEAWQKGVTAANRCVLLDENNGCRAYEARPLVCRKHSVTSPAPDCGTPGASPVPRLIPMNEIIMSAYVTLAESRHGSLSKMLLRTLKTRDLAKIRDLDFVEDVALPPSVRENEEPPL